MAAGCIWTLRYRDDAALFSARLIRFCFIARSIIRLPGIHGNSHYLMLEKNSVQTAGVIAGWLTNRVIPVGARETGEAR